MAKPKNPKPLPGSSRSRRWDEDPAILKRLAEVEELVLAGYPNTVIARHLGDKHATSYSEITIRRDRDRIAELWRRRVTADIVALRGRSVANLERLQRLADNDYRNDRDRVANLRLQMDAEAHKIKVLGVAVPVEQIINLRDSADIALMDSAELRERSSRLEALAASLLAEESGFEGDDPGDDEIDMLLGN